MADSFARTLEVIEEAIREILSDRGVDAGDIDEDRPLFAFEEGVVNSLELDSMDALDVISMLEERLGVVAPDDLDYELIRTVGDLARVVTNEVSEA